MELRGGMRGRPRSFFGLHFLNGEKLKFSCINMLSCLTVGNCRNFASSPCASASTHIHDVIQNVLVHSRSD